MNDLGSPMEVFVRNTVSLMLREIRTKFGQQKLSYAWAFIEPLGWIAMMSLIFKAMGTHNAPLGDSFVIFFATGLVPFAAFRDVSNVVRTAINANRPLLYFPVIKPIDTFISRALLETFTQLVVLVLIIAGYSFYYKTMPAFDLMNVAIPFFLVSLIGFNVGVINCAIMSFFPVWQQIWLVVTKPLLLLSGVFYTAESLPKTGQDVLYWNPVMHCVEWVRMGFFPGFHSNFLDVPFVLSIAFGGLFIALASERLFRARMLAE